MSITQVVLSPPRPLAFTSIPRQLLRTRRMLLLQMASRNSWHLIQEAAADILDQASCERLSVLDDLIQQRAYVKPRQVERALDRMLDTSTASAIDAVPTSRCLACVRSRTRYFASPVRKSVNKISFCRAVRTVMGALPASRDESEHHRRMGVEPRPLSAPLSRSVPLS